MFGFLVGAVIYGATYQSVYPAISTIANLGSVTLPGLLDIDLWLTIVLFVLMSVTLFYFLGRHGELRHAPPEPEPPVESQPPAAQSVELVSSGTAAAASPTDAPPVAK